MLYWIHLEFWKSDDGFAISDLRNLYIPIFIKIVNFSKFLSAMLDPPF